MQNDDKVISSRINFLYKEVFDKYEELNQHNIENLKIFIDSFFSTLKPTMYKNREFKKEIDKYLYPDFGLVGLVNIFSEDRYKQYYFLKNIYDKIQNELELNDNIKIKTKEIKHE